MSVVAAKSSDFPVVWTKWFLFDRISTFISIVHIREVLICMKVASKGHILETS